MLRRLLKIFHSMQPNTKLLTIISLSVTSSYDMTTARSEDILLDCYIIYLLALSLEFKF